MKKRVTVSINEKLEKAIREKQIELIEKTGKSFNFSQTVEHLIYDSLANDRQGEGKLDLIYNNNYTR